MKSHLWYNDGTKGDSMFKSVQYVIKENFSNLYRIYCIAKYELLADMRDSKFGIFLEFCFASYSSFYVLVDLWCGLESKTNRSQ